jgi:hypothetical protein
MSLRKIFMLPLKKCNFITGNNKSVAYGLHRILKFLELEGRNIILLTPKEKSNRSSLHYFWENKKEYETIDDLRLILEDKSVLFRIDLIVLDAWHLRKLEREFQDLVKASEIDTLIIARNYHYTSSEDVCDYHLDYQSTLHSNNEVFIIEDKVNGWKSDVDSLQKSYIRDIKINKLFDKDDDN